MYPSEDDRHAAFAFVLSWGASDRGRINNDTHSTSMASMLHYFRGLIHYKPFERLWKNDPLVISSVKRYIIVVAIIRAGYIRLSHNSNIVSSTKLTPMDIETLCNLDFVQHSTRNRSVFLGFRV